LVLLFFLINQHFSGNTSRVFASNQDISELIDIGLNLFSQERYQEAIEYFDKALAIDPNDTNALTSKADVLSFLESPDEDNGIETYFALLQTADTLLDKGAALFSLGRYEEAIEYFDRAIELDPNNAKAWDNKGSALYGLGRYEKAFEHYVRALQISPNYASAWGNIGITLSSLGRYEEAIPYLDRSIVVRS
jgi:tetratricopeptide (TPR) repeat protein